MADASTFSKIRIGIASPDEIRHWSKGEVKKPETINYRTFKPERDGLFCEKIFGPVKDWECHCGRYKKVKFKGIICDRCGVEVTRSKVRRERMGHIELAAPVCHIWYLKGVPSPLSLILDISPRPLEKVLYFASYIVTDVDRPRINSDWSDIQMAVQQEREQIAEERETIGDRLNREFRREVAEHTAEDVEEEERWDEETIAEKQRYLIERIKQEEKDCDERVEELQQSLVLLEKIEKKQLITEDQYRALERLIEVLTRRLGTSYEGIVRAGLGGAAIKELLEEIDLDVLARDLRNEVQNTQGPKRARAIKRLEVVDAFINSHAHPSWMILECIPVISPELRPMVQLDGGRFATSDLNDLYRRIINRNNRLKKITEIRAPESIVNHEKRLLQEAVDALIDNGRRTRPVVGSNNRPLKSLSDMLKGKEGRFRKNLLGKRVDYSGRSVIVVGPHLKLHQCGLPKEMALELFKPFVMKTLVEHGYTSNIKTAKRMIDKMKPEVWDALEEVIREHPVMLNRAPTLHRLGIQAFEPVLVDGKAIQVHPLVCHAFNADFDGDQMAVHVPLSAYAQAEARILMLSSHNLFSPANGNPIVAPIQDIVLGAYYLTTVLEDAKPGDCVFSGPEEAMLALDSGQIDLHEPIKVRMERTVDLRSLEGGAGAPDGKHLAQDVLNAEGEKIASANDLLDAETLHRLTEAGIQETLVREKIGDSDDPQKWTTVGRLLLNQILPEKLKYADKYLLRTMTKKSVAEVCSEVYEAHGKETTIQFLDELKALGFRYATASGTTISMTDMDIPAKRDDILNETKASVANLHRQYRRGTITLGERRQQVLNLWMEASDKVADAIMEGIDHFNPIYLITDSGARGSSKQITQLSGMRGLMSDPFGNLIEDLPIQSNFHEGLNVLEYFISTHGTRKGLADTALRTADAGYLTRRLVDVSQDVIVRGEDCGTTSGIYVEEIIEGGEVIEKLSERIRGRYAIEDILHPETGEVLVPFDTEISDAQSKEIEEAGIRRVGLRSVLTCELRQGVCQKCYGHDLATGRLVDIGVAVGIIAAQSIGEPGTQLTMRTFHTGGVAGKYLTGVANVKQKRQSTLRDLHEDIRRGLVTFEEEGGSERERVRSVQAVLKVLEEQVHGLLRVVELFEARKPKGQAIITEQGGKVVGIESKGLRHVVLHSPVRVDDVPSHFVGEVAGEDIADEEGSVIVHAGEPITESKFKNHIHGKIKEVVLRKTVLVPYRGELEVKAGDIIEPGNRLTEGPLDPQKVLELQGPRGVQDYLVREIQKVYKSQGVDINDRHVEVIVRQMLKKRRVRHPGDTAFLPGQVVDKFAFEDENERAREAGGAEASADWVLLGITEASLATDSFLSAASFQKTTRVLTEAAVRGKKDELVGLKENVIIGRLIPAGTGLPRYRALEPATPEGEQIVIELSPVREERPALPLPEKEEPMIGSSFADMLEHGTEEAELGAAPQEELFPETETEALSADILPLSILDAGDDDTLDADELLPPGLGLTEPEAKEEEKEEG
jgi:DNA-directed RNA polymerase subunit beta'